MTIRYAKPNDLKPLVELLKLHAAYEEASVNFDKKVNLLETYLFSHVPALKCLVVDDEGELVGYATFMEQFSTWNTGFYIYLDCLFLKEATRGQGVGASIMDTIKAYAQSKNCDTIEWQTPSFNKRAITFYEKLGAKHKAKARFFWSV